VFSVKTPFTVFAPVPDGWTAVGSGFDGGQYGEYWASDLWMQDGNIINALVWVLNTKGYDSGSAEVRAFMTQAGGNAPGGSGARAVMAVLAIPRAGPPPTNVNVVEFYHAGLDHYFITAIPQEISDLDSGCTPVGRDARRSRRTESAALAVPAAGPFVVPTATHRTVSIRTSIRRVPKNASLQW
jgi:hypothetical protein